MKLLKDDAEAGAAETGRLAPFRYFSVGQLMNRDVGTRNMGEPRDDQSRVSGGNPYEVSATESEDLKQQPTAFQILWAFIIAIVAGVIVFFSTCFGTGILLFEFSRINIHSDDPSGLILLAIVVGAIAAGLTIYKTYRSVIRSRVSDVDRKENG
ncbi:MAG: hypothetical protein U0996_16120 [Planctomycetaceae bacterium]